MNTTEQLAQFADGTDLPMTGTWYSHNRVKELLASAWDEGALCRAQADPATSVKTLNPYRALEVSNV